MASNIDDLCNCIIGNLNRTTLLLPIKYNAMTSHLSKKDHDTIEEYGHENLAEAMKKPIVVHYTGSRKPWIYRSEIKADLWWNYYEMQDSEIKRKYLDPFIMEVKLPIALYIKELVRDLTIRLGIYEPVRALKQAICDGRK